MRQYLEDAAAYAADNGFSIGLRPEAFVVSIHARERGDSFHSKLVTYMEVDQARINVLIETMVMMKVVLASDKKA